LVRAAVKAIATGAPLAERETAPGAAAVATPQQEAMAAADSVPVAAKAWPPATGAPPAEGKRAAAAALA